MYCELEKRLLSQHFTSFINLVGHAHDHLCLIWWTKLMSRIPYAKCFLKVDYIYACHRCNRMSHKDGDQRKLGSHSRFYEQQCVKVITDLILELKLFSHARTLEGNWLNLLSILACFRM